MTFDPKGWPSSLTSNKVKVKSNLKKLTILSSLCEVGFSAVKALKTILQTEN